MQKSALARFVLAAAVLVLAGCANAPDLLGLGSSSPTIDRIQRTGLLRVGTAGDYPPLNAIDRAGEYFGLEIDLAQFLARSLGVKLEIVNRPFGELIAAIERNEVDAVLSGVTMTPERNQRVAFAGPYFISGKGVVTRQGSLIQETGVNQLDRAGVTLTALEGTTSESLLRNAMKQATIVAAKDYDSAIQLVIDGGADAMIADYPVCIVAWAKHREQGLSTWPDPFTFEPIGVALPANDPLFVNLVQNYLRSLEGTGLLEQLRDKWLKDASWVRRLP